jgi:hypothetical protein
MNEKKRRFGMMYLSILFLETVCSATSCNGGVCIAAQNSFVCQCPTGQVGDHCQVKFHLELLFLFDQYNILCSMQMFVRIIHVYQLNDVNKLEMFINVCSLFYLRKTNSIYI